MDNVDSWPEVGKAASVPGSGGSAAGSVGGSERGGRDGESAKDGGAPTPPRKSTCFFFALYFHVISCCGVFLVLLVSCSL